MCVRKSCPEKPLIPDRPILDFGLYLLTRSEKKRRFAKKLLFLRHSNQIFYV
jgi:hypothetical protein